MAFDGVDPEDLALIFALQLADLKSSIKGKHKEGDIPDGELALQLYQSELDSMEQFLADRTLCQSIAQAIEQDRDTISSHVQAEEQAASDRKMALFLASDSLQTPIVSPPTLIEEQVPVRFTTNSSLPSAGKVTLGTGVAESSSLAAKRRTMPRGSKPECASCGWTITSSQAVRCPCSHDYCQECIREIFRVSVAEESIFPPRCCQLDIPIGLSREFLHPSLVKAFQAKQAEFNSRNRTYCHHANCSAFIPFFLIKDDVGTCERCTNKTCTICKGACHTGDCPEDTATQEILQLALQSGWRRCYSCHRMVELNEGCYHISCICRAQFCYLCGKEWKTCDCAAFHEHRLTA